LTISWAAYYSYHVGFGGHWRALLSKEFHRFGLEIRVRRLTLDPFRGLVAKDLEIYDRDRRQRVLAQISDLSLDLNYANLLQQEPAQCGRLCEISADRSVVSEAGRIRHGHSIKVYFFPSSSAGPSVPSEFHGISAQFNRRISNSFQLDFHVVEQRTDLSPAFDQGDREAPVPGGTAAAISHFKLISRICSSLAARRPFVRRAKLRANYQLIWLPVLSRKPEADAKAVSYGMLPRWCSPFESGTSEQVRKFGPWVEFGRAALTAPRFHGPKAGPGSQGSWLSGECWAGQTFCFSVNSATNFLPGVVLSVKAEFQNQETPG
jgi:hypothetical protein